MSHIVTVQTQIRDRVALQAACRRAGLAPPQLQTVQLFSGPATGHCVQLPQWRYPVVCQLESGTLQFDNYGGRWGEQHQLDRLLQAYAAEKTLLEARRRGYAVSEQPLPDGRLKLTIQIGDEP